MKILYLSGATFPSEVSHTLSKIRMCQAFADSGHDVALSAASKGIVGDDDVLNFYGLKGGFRLFLKKSHPLWDNLLTRKSLLRGVILSWFHRRSVAVFKPDIVYSRLTITELFFVPSGVDMVYEMHSLGPLGHKLLRPIFLWLVKTKKFTRIIVTTNTLAEILRPIFPGTEIVVARLSAEEPVKISHDEVTQFRERVFQGLGFSHHVGYTGYLDLTGLRGTEIMCQIAQDMPNVAFHIVGGKPDIVKEWKARAHDFNKDRNIFFYGYRNPSEMPYFLNLFDVVLATLQNRPSKQAPTGSGMSPLKLGQYMAYKKAIIASDIVAHREVLTNGKTAILVDSDDVDGWVEALSSLLVDPDKRKSLGEMAYQAYLKDLTPEGRVEKILRGLS